MSASIQAALDEAGKVVKKQKLCTAKVGDSLDKLIELVQSCWAKLSAGSANAIRELQAQAEKQGLMKDMNSSTKELHSSINKLSKVSNGYDVSSMTHQQWPHICCTATGTGQSI
eukprot:GHRR01031133.1.p1 GENE.GHRR01031133.1~~GHRR01031133.1.p1  ORF type:complete len:114 (+),score=35.16 GHRR01031133.1:190-531(+)